MNQYHDDTMYRFIQAMLRRLKAPVSLLLALAMFFIPLSDLSGMFAGPVGGQQDGVNGFVHSTGSAPDLTIVPSGKPFKVLYEVSLDKNSPKSTLSLEVLIPLAIQSPAFATSGSLDLTVIGSSYVVAGSPWISGSTQTISGQTYFVVVADPDIVFGDSTDTYSSQLYVEYCFPNGITPEDSYYVTDFSVRASFDNRLSASYDTLDYITDRRVDAQVGETWSLGKSVSETRYSKLSNPSEWWTSTSGVFPVTDHVARAAYETYSVRVIYKLDVAINADYDSQSIYGRAYNSSFTITDLIQDADVTIGGAANPTATKTMTINEDYFIRDVYMTTHSGNFEGSTKLALGTDYTIDLNGNIELATSQMATRSDGLELRGSTTYYVEVDYPIAKYTVPYGDDLRKYDVPNGAVLTAQFDDILGNYKIIENQTKNSDATYKLGWKLEQPGMMNFELQKSIIVSGSNVVGVGAWQSNYNPTFTVYKVDPVTGQKEATPLTNFNQKALDASGKLVLNDSDLEYNATYVVYEDTFTNFNVTYWDISAGETAADAKSMTNGIVFSTPASNDYFSQRVFKFHVQNTSTSTGPSVFTFDKYIDSATSKTYTRPSVNATVTFDVYVAPKSDAGYLGRIELNSANKFTHTFTKVDAVQHVMYEVASTGLDSYTLGAVNDGTGMKSVDNANGIIVLPNSAQHVIYSAYNGTDLGELKLNKAFLDPQGKTVSRQDAAANAQYPHATYWVYKDVVSPNVPAADAVATVITLNAWNATTTAYRTHNAVQLPAGDYALIEASLSNQTTWRKYDKQTTYEYFTVEPNTTTTLGPTTSDYFINKALWGTGIALKTDATTAPAGNGGIGGVVADKSFTGGVQYYVYDSFPTATSTKLSDTEVNIRTANYRTGSVDYSVYYFDVYIPEGSTSRTVYVLEVQAPTGYSMPANFADRVHELTIVKEVVPSFTTGTSGSTVYPDITSFKNTVAFADYKAVTFTITKKGLTTATVGTNLSGATFAVYARVGNTYQDISAIIPVKASSQTHTMDINLSTVVAAGYSVPLDLVFVETVVPAGYVRPAYLDVNGAIDFTKVPESQKLTLNASGSLSSTTATVWNIPNYELRIAKTVLTASGTSGATFPKELLNEVKFAVYEGATLSTATFVTEIAYVGNFLTNNANSVGEAVYWIRETATNDKYVLSPQIVRLEVKYGVPGTSTPATTVTGHLYSDETDTDPTAIPSSKLIVNDKVITLPFENPERRSANLEKWVETLVPDMYTELTQGSAEFQVYYDVAGTLVGPLKVVQNGAVITVYDTPTSVASEMYFEINASTKYKVSLEGLDVNKSYVIWERSAPSTATVAWKAESAENITIMRDPNVYDVFNFNSANGATTKVYNDRSTGRVVLDKYGFDAYHVVTETYTVYTDVYIPEQIPNPNLGNRVLFDEVYVAANPGAIYDPAMHYYPSEATIGGPNQVYSHTDESQDTRDVRKRQDGSPWKDQYDAADWKITTDHFVNGQFKLVRMVETAPGSGSYDDVFIEFINLTFGDSISSAIRAISTELVPGKYALIETIPPEFLNSPAYQLDQDGNLISMAPDNRLEFDIVDGMDTYVEFYNPRPHGGGGARPIYISILLDKLGHMADDSTVPLNGVVFYVYHGSDQLMVNGEPMSITTGTYIDGGVAVDGRGVSQFFKVGQEWLNSLVPLSDRAQYAVNPYVLTLTLKEAKPHPEFKPSSIEYDVVFSFTYHDTLGWELVDDGVNYLKYSDTNSMFIVNKEKIQPNHILNDKYGITVDVTKTGGANATSGVYAAHFALFSDQACTKPVMYNGQAFTFWTTTDGTKTGTPGKYSFPFTLPIGSYWIKELEAPADHLLSATPVVLNVRSSTYSFTAKNDLKGTITAQKYVYNNGVLTSVPATVQAYMAVELYAYDDYVGSLSKITTLYVHNHGSNVTVQDDQGNTYAYNAALFVSYGFLDDGKYLLRETKFHPAAGTASAITTFSDPIDIYVTIAGGKVVSSEARLRNTGASTSLSLGTVPVKIPNPLLGRVMANKDILTYEGTTINPKNNSSYSATFTVYSNDAFSDNSIVGTFAVSSSTSVHNYLYLEAGTYYIVETAVVSPSGDVQPLGTSCVWNVTIGNGDTIYIGTDVDGNPVWNTSSTTKVVNLSKNGEAKIYKQNTDAQNRRNMAGAQFVVYLATDNPAEGIDGTEVKTASNVAYYIHKDQGTWKTVYANANGELFLDSAFQNSAGKFMREGNYIVYETVPPTGYLLSTDNNPQILTVVARTKATTPSAALGSGTTLVNAVVFRNPKLTEAALVKYDGAETDPLVKGLTAAQKLAGAVFAVYYSDDGVNYGTDEIDYTIHLDPAVNPNNLPITNNGGVLKLTNLYPGYWSFYEITAPQGYNNPEPAFVSPATSAPTRTVFVDPATPSGESFALFDEKGDALHRNLPLSKPIYTGDFLLAANTHNGFNVDITKIDGNSQQLLKGAEFQVYAVPATLTPTEAAQLVPGFEDALQHHVGAAVYDDATGHYILSRISENANGYWIVETRAPNGKYHLNGIASDFATYVPWVTGGHMVATIENFEYVDYPDLLGAIDKAVWVNGLGQSAWQTTYNMDEEMLHIPGASYDVDSNIPVEDLTLYAGDLRATYWLYNFTPDAGSPNAFANGFDSVRVTDETISYVGGKDRTESITLNDGDFEITQIRVLPATFLDPSGTPVNADVQLLFKSSLAGGWIDNNPVKTTTGTATFNLPAGTVAFMVYYGKIVNSVFEYAVGPEFTADGGIEFDVVYAKRTSNSNEYAVRSISNQGAIQFVYTEYGSTLGSGVTRIIEEDSNEVNHYLPSVDGELPIIAVDKEVVSSDFYPIRNNQTNVNAFIEYTIEMSTTEGVLYQPVLIDKWNRNQVLPTTLMVNNQVYYDISANDQADIDNLMQPGSPVVTFRDNDNAVIWEFPGYLEKDKPVTITFYTYVSPFPVHDNSRVINYTYLTSSKLLNQSMENPGGLSYKESQNLVQEAAIDAILNRFRASYDWGTHGNRYASDRTELTISFGNSLTLGKEVKGSLNQDFSSAGRTTYDGTFTYRLTATNMSTSGTAEFAFARLVDHLPQSVDNDPTNPAGTNPPLGNFITSKPGEHRNPETEWNRRPNVVNAWVEDGDGNLINSSTYTIYYRTAATAATATRQAYEIAHPSLYASGSQYDLTRWQTGNDWTTTEFGWVAYNGSGDVGIYMAIDIGVDYQDTVFDQGVVRILYMDMKVHDDFKFNDVLAMNVDTDAWNDVAMSSIILSNGTPQTLASLVQAMPVVVTLDGFDVAVGNFIWEDRNYNGLQDADELVVVGMNVTLERATYIVDTAGNIDWNHPVVDYLNTKTNDEGYYWFNHLSPNYYDITNGSVQGRTYTQYRLFASIPDDVELRDVVNDVWYPAHTGQDFFFTLNGQGIRHNNSDGDTTLDIPTGGANHPVSKYADGIGATAPFELVWTDITGNNVNTLLDPNDTSNTDDFMVVFDPTDPTHTAWNFGDPTWDFGILRLGAIGNYVWYDNRYIELGHANNTLPDGYQWENQAGNEHDARRGVEGMLVQLLDGNGRVLESQLTDADGHYLFTDLPAGEYSVIFHLYYDGDYTLLPGINSQPGDFRDFKWTLLTGTSSSTEDFANNAEYDGHTLIPGTTQYMQSVDSNAVISITDFAYSSGKIDLGYGQWNLTIDAGIVQLHNALGDYVWFDENRDGIQDANEHGWNDLIVELYKGDTKIDETKTSHHNGKDGWYMFFDIPVGDDIRVRFTTPDGDYIWSIIDQGNEANDTNALNVGNGGWSFSRPISVHALTYDLTWDAGFNIRPDNPPPPYYNDHNTVITIPGGTPANTVLNFSLPDGQTVSYTVPVNIPADQSVAFEFDQNSTPLTNLPQLLTEDLIVKHPDLFEFDSETPLVVIPATFDSATLMAIFWSLMFLTVLGAGAFAFRKRFHV